jgi:catechol 2,3-dioxygenase-like lactoylglutathione lyase family enzyme
MTVCEQVHPTLVVDDVRAAADFYTTKLGFTLGFLWGDPATTAGVNLGSVQLMLTRGTPQAEGFSVYFVVEDVDKLHELQRGQSAPILAPPEDKPWGMRQYAVHDPNGHLLIFGEHRPATTPKLEIERVDVPVRLERRLAAVLTDVAASKGMTVGNCLEEILLHSFDGPASAHTRATLEHIQALKKKHGLDYDVHASHRFVEKTP